MYLSPISDTSVSLAVLAGQFRNKMATLQIFMGALKSAGLEFGFYGPNLSGMSVCHVYVQHVYTYVHKYTYIILALSTRL